MGSSSNADTDDLQNSSDNFASLSLPTPSCAIMPEFRKVNALPSTQNQLPFWDGDSDRISNQRCLQMGYRITEYNYLDKLRLLK